MREGSGHNMEAKQVPTTNKNDPKTLSMLTKSVLANYTQRILKMLLEILSQVWDILPILLQIKGNKPIQVRHLTLMVQYWIKSAQKCSLQLDYFLCKQITSMNAMCTLLGQPGMYPLQLSCQVQWVIREWKSLVHQSGQNLCPVPRLKTNHLMTQTP